MTNTMKPISLECQWEPSWEDAKTRLAVAAETLEFPFCIATDETPIAYKGVEHFIEHHEYGAAEQEDASTWWNNYHQPVNNMEEALRTLYPWFHDGEEMPE